MGSEYQPAIDMWLDPNLYPFTDALLSPPLSPSDLSIVIHGTGGGGSGIPTAQEVAQFFANDLERKSSHFIIGQDGVVVQCIHLKDGAGANCCVESGFDAYWNPLVSRYGNLNRCTISIEHCSNSNNDSFTDVQLSASYALVGWLCQKFHIPPDRIKTHQSIDPISRSRCPGSYPMSTLIAKVTNMSNAFITQAAFDTWHSVFFNGTHLPYDTGIAKAWQSQYLSGKNMAPPTCAEYGSVRWNGQPIRVQLFGMDRCEWDGAPHWFVMGV